MAGFANFVNAFALSPGTPAKSLNEYVAWVRSQGQRQGRRRRAGAGLLTPEFLVKVLGEKFKLDLVAAPYRGSAPMIGDMLGNQIAAGVGSVPDFIDNHKGGRLRVVAVLGGKRQPTLPEVPTLAELGISGFETCRSTASSAPAGTPKAAIDGFSAALAKVIAMPTCASGSPRSASTSSS